MEPESSGASRLPWIWFLECLAKNKEVDYLTLHDVARKVPGLSENAATNARELLALRCLEGLAETCNEAGASGCGSKIGLDFSQRCSVVLFHLTSEAIKSGSGLEGIGMSKWDIRSFVEHKRAQLPKCTLEVLEDMVLEGKDPAAESLRKICGMNNADHSEDMNMVRGVAEGVSLACDETCHHQVAAGTQHVMGSIPENEVETERGSCLDRSKDELLQEAMVGKDVPLNDSMEETRDEVDNERQPPQVGDNAFDVEGYGNENIDASSLKNTFMSSQCTLVDPTEPVLCMKCNKSGPLLCCSASVCSVAVHIDCLGVEPCFDGSGSFFCPFCASSTATADYLEAERRAGIRKRELDVYLSSSLSSKFLQVIQNKKSRRNLKQGGLFSPTKGHKDEEKAGTDWKQPTQSGEHRDHIIPEIDGDADVNAAPESSGAGMATDLPDREKAMEHSDIGVSETVEPPILQDEDIIPSRGKNTTDDSTTCQPQPQDAFTQPSRISQEAEPQNCYAIVPYEGNKMCDKKNTISQNHPEFRSNHVRAVRNIPKITISNATSHVPFQSYPSNRRRRVPWTDEEEDKLTEGVKKFYNPEAGSIIPWARILEFGALVFQPSRTAENLKDKWRNICKKDK